MPVGKVYLVGAGPGDPGLLTLRGKEALERAEVVVADYLVNPAILQHAPVDAEVIVRPRRRQGLYGGQEELNQLLVERAVRGQTVVRLKGGDPFVFGRGAEEAEALVLAGVPFEVVPGVTAAVGAPAYAGIPLTHRGLSGVVAFATGHEADDKEGGGIEWEAVARAAGTLVLYMSVKRLPEVIARLTAAGRSPDEPVAVIEWGTWPRQRTVEATLATVVEKAEAAGFRPPALTIVGPVVQLRERLRWFEERPRRRLLLLSTRPDEAPAPPGLEVTRCSPFQIVPRFHDVKRALQNLEQQRTIAFASAHAVDAVLSALAASGRDARALAGVRLAAVGAATARRLEERSLRADLVSDGGGAGLAREIAEAELPGPILLPRASGGRAELEEGLRAAGYTVETVDAYDSVADEPALARCARAHRLEPFDAIAFASPKGVRAFLDAVGGSERLGAALVGAIGETTRSALAEAGVTVGVTAERPSQAALVQALAARLGIE